MSTPESIAQAFAKGLMEGLLVQKDAKEKRPQVVQKQAVAEAVRDEVRRLLEETPSAEQLDIFARDIENAPVDPIAEMTLQRVAEARARAQQQQDQEENPRPESYDPNAPNLSGWTTP